MSKNFFFLIAIIFLSNCSLFVESMPKGWNWGAKPRPLTGVGHFPSGDTEYGKGFKDGCASGWDAVAKGLAGELKAKYDFKRMQKSPDYNSGWWDGYEQCIYILDWEIV